MAKLIDKSKMIDDSNQGTTDAKNQWWSCQDCLTNSANSCETATTTVGDGGGNKTAGSPPGGGSGGAGFKTVITGSPPGGGGGGGFETVNTGSPPAFGELIQTVIVSCV